jgi:glycosyltransferase involved in cell wall biosynthesis
VKVLHVPFAYPPDPVGGTEVYVAGLARALGARGIESVVAAPGPPLRYVHDGLPVVRFETTTGRVDPALLQGDGDPVAAAAFGRLLDRERPDVVHLHALTSGVSLRGAREARRRGLPVAFTYHTPTVTCVRGTLLREGTEVCDGALDGPRCARCALDGLGVPRWLARPLGAVPVGVGRALGAAGLAGGAFTAARMSALVAERHRAVRAFLGEVDRVVALCRWTADLLDRLGVPRARVVVSPHGLGEAAPARPRPVAARPAGDPLRVAFLGRLDPTKGADLLVDALRALPGAPVVLDLHGVAQGPAGARYRSELRRRAAGDGRVRFREAVEPRAVVDLLRDADVLAVPSRWLETGPLVVLEAFAAGTPVLGAALGGIAELVRDGVDGLLVPAGDRDAWRAALARLAADRDLVATLRAGVRPPRPMTAVAAEMAALYGGLLDERRGAQGAVVPAPGAAGP